MRARVKRVLEQLWRVSPRIWRRSIQARVVITTMVLSAIVIGIVGWALLRQVADGLVDARRSVAVAEARAGFVNAQEQLDASSVSDANSQSQLLNRLVNDLTSRSGSPRSYEVVLEGPVGLGGLDSPDVAVRSSGDIDSSSVPRELLRSVSRETGTHYTFTRLSIAGLADAPPAIVVGSQLRMADANETYALYYLFSMRDQENTLSLVRHALVYGGVALMLLASGVAWLVTRQVVTPVRLARRIAERLAAGRLEERMHVRGEDDLARLSISFNQMATNLQRQIRQLEELSRLQHRFVSDVSHELRTPIATVRMAADVLHDSRDSFDPLTARSAELLQTELDRFESLLADLLEISRFDAGAARLDLEEIDLVDIANRVVDHYSGLAVRRDTRLSVISAQGSAVVEADVRRIDRIVRNLVVNAIHYSDSDRIEIFVAAGEGSAALAVRDYGVGLQPGDSQLVFNRFWRADPARERTRGGTGLGLAISMEDAALHGGWLQAWGEPGKGSQFRLTLPTRAGDDVERSPIPLVPESRTPPRAVTR